MKLVITFEDLLLVAMLGVAFIIFVFGIIQVLTREWRYKHFKCPKCGNCWNGHCTKIRNWREQCKYFYRKGKTK